MAGLSGRMRWADVAPSVQEAVAQILGSPVIDARSQAGGFSPGSADRVVTADGRRAFVKTGFARLNAESCDIHRREAEVTALLPARLPAPRLLGFTDLGEWVAIVLEDVDGRQPRQPWQEDELHAVLDAYADLAAEPMPEALAVLLPSAQERLADWSAAWSGDLALRLAAEDTLPAPLAAWVSDVGALLPTLAERVGPAAAGDPLVHFDARADNVLLRPGGAVIVDWPWAIRGAAWIDPMCLLMTVRLEDPALAVPAEAHPAFDGMDDDGADSLVAAIAGGMLSGSLQPAPPGIPTLRSFQRRQGIACLEWLQERRARRS